MKFGANPQHRLQLFILPAGGNRGLHFLDFGESCLDKSWIEHEIFGKNAGFQEV